MRREKSIGCSASSSGVSFINVRWDLAAYSLNKETKGTVGPFRSSSARHPYSKKSKKIYIFTSRCEHFSTGWEIDMEVVDGLIHAEEFEKKHYEAFLLKKLVEDKKSFV